MDLCDICKRKPAKIHVEGEGDFCLDCYNAEILERIGKEDTFDYPRQITVMEPGGAVHTFDIEHVILGTLVSWEATEIAGNYSFRECSDIDENGAEVAERFLKKIVKGVCTKSLAIEDNRASNLVHKDGKTYRIKDKGVINIIEDEDNNFQPAFVVDGIKFTMEEFAELFGANIGFNIHFQQIIPPKDVDVFMAMLLLLLSDFVNCFGNTQQRQLLLHCTHVKGCLGHAVDGGRRFVLTDGGRALSPHFQ